MLQESREREAGGGGRKGAIYIESDGEPAAEEGNGSGRVAEPAGTEREGE